jgi:hypothetical protein
MNERSFLQTIAEDEEARKSLENIVEDMLHEVCVKHEIPRNEISDAELTELAGGIVERGLHIEQ